MSVQKVEKNTLSTDIVENVLIHGDLSKLDAKQRLVYYNKLCESLGLNPLTRPMEFIKLQGKDTLYLRKDATEQLRKINSITIDKVEDKIINESVYVVTSYGHDKSDRHDVAKGAVSIAGLKGDALANAIMKAETKSKRRLTLSICGLGFLDESELETIPEVKANSLNKIKNEESAAENVDERMADYILKMDKINKMNDLAEIFKEAKGYANSRGALEKWKEILMKAKEKRKSELELKISESEKGFLDGVDIEASENDYSHGEVN